MKTKILFSFLTLGFLAIPAHADLVCETKDGFTTLTLHATPGQRLDAQVLLNKNGEEIRFGAVQEPSNPEGPLYSKKDYRLFGYPQLRAKLSIATRKFIGRGGQGIPSSITAKFTQGEYEALFTCHEELD